MNVLLGLVLLKATAGSLDHVATVRAFTILYALNMYFQSFGAVSIVKVNASWFHVRERGLLGGVFGVLISLGLYFAYDWSRAVAHAFGMAAAFFVPALILFAFTVFNAFVIRDTPALAGLQNFDTADASSGDDGAPSKLVDVARRMFSNPVILVIVAIEFCSGFLRNAVMKWYLVFADKTGVGGGFVAKNWGVALCAAGILGGMVAGVVSDRVFDSRRGPVASVLYGGMVVTSLAMFFLLGTGAIGWLAIAMSLCVIGVHGMLSGTASMDFGGRKNAGMATGIIDGFVYLGTAMQAFLFARVLPSGDAAKVPDAWKSWPLAMIPVAVIGLALATRVWNAKPQPGAGKRSST